METVTAIKRAIDILGGPVKAAEMLKVGRYQNIQQWALAGSVPPKYCPAIERATNGQVRCEDLRPDVDWGYLRSTCVTTNP